MLELNILNMKGFLETVNSCVGEVNMLDPQGRKVDINRQYRLQSKLQKQYQENKDCLRITLDVPKPRDYMQIVSYYAGDC